MGRRFRLSSRAVRTRYKYSMVSFTLDAIMGLLLQYWLALYSVAFHQCTLRSDGYRAESRFKGKYSAIRMVGCGSAGKALRPCPREMKTFH